MNRAAIEAQLAFKRAALKEAQEAYLDLLKMGAKSYGVGSRSLTKLDLPQLESTIFNLEREIAGLEEVLRGGKRRRAVGVIPRDY